MLVPFVIDADSLSPDPAWAPGTVRACHDSLLDVWRRFGLLMHDGQSFEESALHRALPDLPIKVRSLWQELLEVARPVPCGMSWNGSVNHAALLSCKWTPRLALVDDTRALAEFGISDVEDERVVPSCASTTVDICRLQAAGAARSFAAAKLLASGHIQPTETYQEIWDKRFAGLARAPIKHIALVDRYAVEQHVVKCPQSQLSGICRFLKLLDRSGGGKRYIKLFSAWTKDLAGATIESIAKNLREEAQNLQLTHIRQLELVMTPDVPFGLVAHDRFVRFGMYVWDIGIGLDVFQGPSAGKASAATFKTGEVVREYERIEAELAYSQGAKRIRVFG